MGRPAPRGIIDVGAYEEGQPVPLGHRVEQRTRRGLLLAGGILFGVAYVGFGAYSVANPADGGAEAWPWMFAPVVGPLIASTEADYAPDAASRPHLGVYWIASGCQSAGITLLLFGLLAPEARLVRDAKFRNAIHRSVAVGPKSIHFRYQF